MSPAWMRIGTPLLLCAAVVYCGAPILTWLHFAAVEHSYCPEHGRLAHVHGHDEGHAAAHGPEHGVSRHPAHESHDPCGDQASATRRVLSVPSPLRVIVPLEVASTAARVHVVSVPLSRGVLFVAPKRSPPAVSLFA